MIGRRKWRKPAKTVVVKSYSPFTRADDEVMLDILDKRDGDGLSAGQIAEHYNVTRNSIIGKMHRVNKVEITACACVKPENKDGAMGRRWWA